MDYQMDTKLKEVQRKTNMSLEDIIKEQRKPRGNRGKRGTLNRTGSQGDPKKFQSVTKGIRGRRGKLLGRPISRQDMKEQQGSEMSMMGMKNPPQQYKVRRLSDRLRMMNRTMATNRPEEDFKISAKRRQRPSTLIPTRVNPMNSTTIRPKKIDPRNIMITVVNEPEEGPIRQPRTPKEQSYALSKNQRRMPFSRSPRQPFTHSMDDGRRQRQVFSPHSMSPMMSHYSTESSSLSGTFPRTKRNSHFSRRH